MNDRIVLVPKIHRGKPVIKGTRVPIVAITGGLAGGMSMEEVCRDYEVTEEDVRAALSYAAGLIDSERVYPLLMPKETEPHF